MKTITFTIPTVSLPTAKVKSLRDLIVHKASPVTQITNTQTLSDSDYVNQSSTTTHSNRRSGVAKLRRMVGNNKKYFKFLPLLIVGLVIVVSVGMFLRRDNQNVLGSHDKQNIHLEDPNSVQEINKTLSFPVIDNSGEEVGKVQYTIEKAELRDQLIIKGQQARAVEGKEFLILHLKLKNDTNSSISVNTRDFIRLKMKGTEEQFAPTIHNDPVEVQAISSLTTRLGFSINETDEDLSLLFGEITGEKENIDLNL